jgi:hypothetical protein
VVKLLLVDINREFADNSIMPISTLMYGRMVCCYKRNEVSQKATNTIHTAYMLGYVVLLYTPRH